MVRRISTRRSSSLYRVFGPRRAGGRGQRGRRRRSWNVDRGRPHAFSTREAPVRPTCGGRAGAAHLLDPHRRKGFSSSMRRMRSRSSSFSMAISAMTSFCRRPCSSSWASCRALSASAPPARKASRHSLRVAAVTPSFRLVDSRSAPRSSSRTTLALRLADQRPLPPRPISGPAPVALRVAQVGRKADDSWWICLIPCPLVSVSRKRANGERYLVRDPYEGMSSMLPTTRSRPRRFAA